LLFSTVEAQLGRACSSHVIQSVFVWCKSCH